VGRRTPTTFDALWKAACAESNAREAEAAGLPESAKGYRREAGRIIRAAARGTAA